jgi:hypothetical protein
MTPDNPQYYDILVGSDGIQVAEYYGPRCAACHEMIPHLKPVEDKLFCEDCYLELPLCTNAGCDKRILGEVVLDAEGDPWHPDCKRESESQ